MEDNMIKKIRDGMVYAASVAVLSLGLGTSPVYAQQQTQSQATQESAENKEMYNEIKECAGALKDYWLKFSELESTRCLEGFTNPDTWNPIGAKVQAVECGVRAAVDYLKHTSPEQQKEGIEQLLKVYDGFQEVRRIVEHPDPNAELFYKAISDHIDGLDKQAQTLEGVASKECSEALSKVYEAGKKVLEGSNKDIEYDAEVMEVFSEELKKYVENTPREAQNCYAAAAILEAAKKEVHNRMYERRDNAGRTSQDNEAIDQGFYGAHPELNGRRLDPSNSEDELLINEWVARAREYDSNKTQQTTGQEQQGTNPRVEEQRRETQTPSISRESPNLPPRDSAGRTPKENESIDDGFRRANPDAPARLDPTNPAHKEWIRDWVQRAREQDRRNGR